VLPDLLAALPTEGSEFVRPALLRALAAHGSDARVQTALPPLVMRGEDLFRGALIVALGEYGGRYALPQILEVARLDGPLRDDAITALGQIGDAAATPILAALQPTAPEEVQPTIAAAYCLLETPCQDQETYLREVLRSAVADRTHQPMLRAVAHALSVLAMGGRGWALTALFDAGVPAREPARAPIALGIGSVALRTPLHLLDALEGRPDLDEGVLIVRDAFDMLSEDFEEERFALAIRQALWDAPEGSARRRAAESLMAGLEF